jgi:purine-binding chemotaxis protein CheW
MPGHSGIAMLRNTNNKKTTVAEEIAQIVTFHVGREEFGLDIGAITEAIRPLPVTPLPRMPQFVEGVINLRGIIIPVVDLRKRFGLTEIRSSPRTMRMVIIRGAVDGTRSPQKLLALVVDSVREVLHIPLRQIEPAPAAATGEQAGFIGGVAKAMDRLIIIIDITKILSGEERTALAEAGNVHP